ncbi:MAG: hypothetical protein ACTFAK_02840 [Candidatus Electronema sp. VV]
MTESGISAEFPCLPEHMPMSMLLENDLKRSGVSLNPVKRKSCNDPPDRIIATIALVMGLPLVTKDEKIRAYPHLRTIWDD